MSRSIAAVTALTALVLCGCGGDRGDARKAEQLAKLQRDTRALAEAVAAAKAGELFQPGNVIVGVHEDAVARLFSELLPMTGTIKGRDRARDLEIRVDRATVKFDGGLGTVELQGRASLAEWPSVAADFTLSGGFSEARIADGVLHARLGLDTLDARPLPGGLLARLLRGDLLRSLNALGREEIPALLPPLQLPVRLEQRVSIPDLTEDPVHTRGGSFEVKVTFTRMLARDGRLWLQLEPELGKWQRNEATR
jgi:hypothetical protein